MADHENKHDLEARLAVLEEIYEEIVNGRISRLEGGFSKIQEQLNSDRFVQSEIYRDDLSKEHDLDVSVADKLGHFVQVEDYREDTKNLNTWRDQVNNKLSLIWGALGLITIGLPVLLHFITK